MYEIEYCTSVGFILRNGVVEKKKEKPRGFSSTFIFGSHFFSPVASIFSLLPPLPPCSCPFLSLRPQLLLPLFLSVYLVPGG